MDSIKPYIKMAIVSLAVTAAYHNGLLSFVPVFKGTKKD